MANWLASLRAKSSLLTITSPEVGFSKPKMAQKLTYNGPKNE